MRQEESSSKVDLLHAAQEAVASRPDKPKATAAVRETRRALWAGLFLLAATVGWVLIARPPWVFPTPLPPDTPAVALATIRIAMVREQARILSFVRVHGRLPTSLEEAGGTVPAVEYLPGPGTVFRLRAVEAGTVHELSSSDDAGMFLGTSVQLILERRIDP